MNINICDYQSHFVITSYHCISLLYFNKKYRKILYTIKKPMDKKVVIEKFHG